LILKGHQNHPWGWDEKYIYNFFYSTQSTYLQRFRDFIEEKESAITNKQINKQTNKQINKQTNTVDYLVANAYFAISLVSTKPTIKKFINSPKSHFSQKV